MTTYSVNFSNNTDRTWTIGIYQTLPNSGGLDSVSWLQSTAPPNGSTDILFEQTYNISTADYTQIRGIDVYRAVQTIGTQRGTAWKVVFADGLQQLQPAGSAPLPQQILIENVSGIAANAGIGMSGSPSVYKRNLTTGAAVQFEVTPTYYIGLFNNLIYGEVISNNVLIGPQVLGYPEGETEATVTASMEGGDIILRIDYGSTISTS